MRRTLLAVGVALAAAGPALADGPFQFKPIDTEKLIVRPTDQATGFFSGVTRTFSRIAGGSIESNGFVRTINNLFGTRAQSAPIQMNGIPLPSAYPSTTYQNSFVPALPTTTQFQR